MELVRNRDIRSSDNDLISGMFRDDLPSIGILMEDNCTYPFVRGWW